MQTRSRSSASANSNSDSDFEIIEANIPPIININQVPIIMTSYDIKPTAFSFAHETLTVITDQPTHDSIIKLKQEIYANAMGIDCTLGGGEFGYLGIIMTPAEYSKHCIDSHVDDIPFTAPIAPDANATPEAIRAYQQLNADYKAMKMTLRRQLIAAIDREYLSGLIHPTLGLATTTALDILEYITKKFDKITHDDLEANRLKLAAPWDVTEPIHKLWRRIETCQQFATAGGKSIDDDTVINTILGVLQGTGVFTTYVMLWRRTPRVMWTLTEFYTFFEEANEERISITAKEAGYHGANLASKTTKPTISTDTPKPLSSKVSEATKDGRCCIIGDKVVWYCWSHGGGLASSHTSQTCTRPRDGHKKEATWNNLMGGSTRMNHTKENRAYYTEKFGIKKDTANKAVTTQVEN